MKLEDILGSSRFGGPEGFAGEFSVVVGNRAGIYFPEIKIDSSNKISLESLVLEMRIGEALEAGAIEEVQYLRALSHELDILSATTAQELLTCRGLPELLASPDFTDFVITCAQRNNGRCIFDSGVMKEKPYIVSEIEQVRKKISHVRRFVISFE